MAKDRMFRDKDFIERLLTLALPIAVQSFLLASVAAADAFMLGRLDQNSMAAVSLATQIQFVQNVIVASVVAAEVILGAQYWGKGDKDAMERIFFLSLRISVAASLLFFLGCVLAPETLMKIFASDPDLIAIGSRYLRIAGWSYLLTGISQCYLAIFKVTDHPNTATVVSTIAVVLNILLNALFIFGLLGLPAMGAEGAATATLVARVVELVLSVALCFGKDNLSPRLKRLFVKAGALAKDFWVCLLPLIGAYMVWGLGFTSYTAFMGHLGPDAAAANSVCAVIRDLVCCLCSGAASGGGILVGNELGAGNLEKGKLYGGRLARLAFMLGFLSTAIVLLCLPLSLAFVELTPEAIRLLYGMMVITAFYMIGRTVNTIVINGIFAAGGDTAFDLYSLTIVMWGFAVPLAALGTFVFHWHPLLVFGCTCLDEVGKIPWVMAHYRKYKWVRNLTK